MTLYILINPEYLIITCPFLGLYPILTAYMAGPFVLPIPYTFLHSFDLFDLLDRFFSPYPPVVLLCVSILLNLLVHLGRLFPQPADPVYTAQLWADMASAPRAHTYSGLLSFVVLVLLLCGILAGLAYLLSLTAAQDPEKRSEYECGFAPFDSATRHPFEVHFYVVGILFLIFDVEIALLFPWVLTIEATGVFSYLMMFQFIYILAVGFHYEWKRGALIWPARYSPSRLSVVSAKWFSLVAFVLVTDLPAELLLLGPAVSVDETVVPEEDPTDAGVKFRRLKRFKYEPVYGPHPENSPRYVYLAACEEACKPLIGPMLRPQRPYIEVYEKSEQRRIILEWQMYNFLRQPELTTITLGYAHRWWFRRIWPWRRTPFKVGRQEDLAKNPLWRRVAARGLVIVCVFLVLLVLSLAWRAVIGDFHNSGKQAFLELLSKINTHFLKNIPGFKELSATVQLTISALLLGPWYAARFAINNWMLLSVATLVYSRIVFLCVFSGRGAHLRHRSDRCSYGELLVDQERAYVASRGGVYWEEIPSKFHPDKGCTDEQHVEYVKYTSATNRKTKNDNWSAPTLFALLDLNETSYLLSSLASAARYGAELLTALLPEVTLMIMIVYLVKVIGIELGRRRLKKVLAIEALGAAQEVLGFVVWLYLIQVHFVETVPVLAGYFIWAVGITVSKFFVAVTSLFVLAFSENYVRQNTRHLLEYPIMLLLAILLLLCLVGANNLMTMFLCIGGFSISLYVLILFDVYAKVAREAAMKYFYLSAMSAGLIVFGTFLIYTATGTAMFSELRWAFLSRADVNLITSSTGLAFIILGLFFKLSAFPAHLWAVEVYEGSPAPIMAFFLLPVKMAVLFVFVRLLNTAFIGVAYLWLPCVAIACAGSLLWGAFAALYERKISRFLGYASINQLGYLLMGTACDTDEALRSMYIYLLLYVIMSGGFLFVYMHTRRKGKLNLLYISDFRGFVVQERKLAWSLTVFLFSSVGIPPLVGFHAKYIVLVAAMQKELFILAVAGIAVGLLSAYYYLQFVVSFKFEEQNYITPTRCILSKDERLAVTGVEAVLWLAPLLGPTLLPVFQVIAESALTCGTTAVGAICNRRELGVRWDTACAHPTLSPGIPLWFAVGGCVTLAGITCAPSVAVTVVNLAIDYPDEVGCLIANGALTYLL